MQIVKVHFGGTKPPATEYIKKADGMAEVWLYRDAHEEVDTDGNSDFVADGVCITTCLTEEEVEQNRDLYFADDAESDISPKEETYIEDEQGNKYEQTIVDGKTELKLVEDNAGKMYL